MTTNKSGKPTSGGVPVTDDLIESLAAEADTGFDVDALQQRGGRKPMGSAAADVVPIRMDPELKQALSRRAERDHTSASDVVRQALRAWLDVA
jgi:hypothetical protein